MLWIQHHYQHQHLSTLDRLLICKTLYFIEFREVSLRHSAEISLISNNEELIDISIIFFFFSMFVYSFGLAFLAENLVLL